MQELIKHLAIERDSPRLWFERLVVFSEPDPEHYIRSITFKRGLNIIWAKEPASGSATGIHAAGHGVGKTSLCLLLRYCLGDGAKSIADLREELLSAFPNGGVAAVIHLDGEAFSVYRFFNSYREGGAFSGNNIDQIFASQVEQTDRQFEQQLADIMMSTVSPKVIPDTGQPIEWRHVLAWMSRDQGSRFKSFFAWREGEGTGLQRSRQDPPIVMRAVLGLLDLAESVLMEKISKLESDLVMAKHETSRLLQEPELIRRRIESELRAFLHVPEDIPFHSSDMFVQSVTLSAQEADQKATKKLAELDAQHESVTHEIINCRTELKLLDDQLALAQAEYDLADAARRNDEVAYQALASKLLKLKQLAGWCEHGNTQFQHCDYVKNEIVKLENSSDIKVGRNTIALQNAMAESAKLVNSASERKNQLEISSRPLRTLLAEKDMEHRKIRMKRDSLVIEDRRGSRLLEEFERWESTSGSSEAKSSINDSITRTQEIVREIDSAKTKLAVLQNENSSRSKLLCEIANLLTVKLLSNEAFGDFDGRDESRPFKLSMRGGEAYRVLEVLLGDLVCMLDGSSQKSAFPGFVIHDCPREADMSAGLYGNFLEMVEEIEREIFSENIPFQYIVTTTSQPPVGIQELPYLRDTLDPSCDDGLLFRQRL